jgi:pyruvate formate lyase activating enzyme
MTITGTVYNIQSYSIHDGPGIRTVVFLKGCPLKCRWCSNPESQSFEREVYYSVLRCMKCGLCVSACPNEALILQEKGILVYRDRCNKCGVCAEMCPTEAISISGRIVTPDEVIKEIHKDRSYIMNSGGGVTFSGGEPYEQPDFLAETVRQLKKEGYHIAVETSGCTDYKNIEKSLDDIDLLLYDMKTSSGTLHEKATGMDNGRILENLKRLQGKVPIIIRIPIIPGVNDSADELDRMIESIQSICGDAEVNLLPYHKLGKSKYQAIGRAYQSDEIVIPDAGYMEGIIQQFLKKNLRASIV